MAEMFPSVYTVHLNIKHQSAGLYWLDMRIVLETVETWRKTKKQNPPSVFASDFRLRRAFMIGRVKRLENLPAHRRMSEGGLRSAV